LSGRRGSKVWVLVWVLIAVFVARELYVARTTSVTVDEPVHLVAGLSYLTRGDFRINPEHPPLVKLLAGACALALRPSVPSPEDSPGLATVEWSAANHFCWQNKERLDTLFLLGRLPVIAMGVLLLLLVFVWASDLYGKKAGLLSLFLASFCPNLLAHSCLITTDTALALCLIWTFFLADRCARRPDVRSVFLLGVAIGCCLGAKFTAPVVLVPSFAVLVLLHFKSVRQESTGRVSPAVRVVCLCVVPLLLISGLYGFSHIGWYARGFLEVFSQAGGKGSVSYLNGWYSPEGFRTYFIWAILYKVPVAGLLLVCLACTGGRPNRREMFLIAPAAVLFFFASMSRKQVGIRYILPVLPFLYIFAGRIFRAAEQKVSAGRAVKVAAGCLAVCYGVASLACHPHYLSCFNSLAGGPDNGWRHLIDSNIDWGQDIRRLKAFLEREGNPEVQLSCFASISPRVYGLAYQPLLMRVFPESFSPVIQRNSLSPRRELLVVSVNQMHGLLFDEKDMLILSWLRQVPPAAKVGYSIFVYDITRDIAIRRKLLSVYEAVGHTAYADRERAILAKLEQEKPPGDLP